MGGAAEIIIDGRAEIFALDRTGEPLLDGFGYGASTGRRQDPGYRLISDRLNDLPGAFRERLGETIRIQVLPQGEPARIP